MKLRNRYISRTFEQVFPHNLVLEFLIETTGGFMVHLFFLIKHYLNRGRPYHWARSERHDFNPSRARNFFVNL